MSVRGVWQLRKLQLYYDAKFAGSSRGVRQFVKSDLIQWARSNPQIEIEAIHKATKEPHLTGHYLDQKEPITVGLMNAPAERCKFVFDLLRNRSLRLGKSRLDMWPKPQTATRSLQGKWNEHYRFDVVPEPLPRTQPPTAKAAEQPPANATVGENGRDGARK